MFSAESVIAFVPRIISPLFDSFAVLQVIFPFSLVFCTVHMLVDSLSVGFVICPVSFIDISIHVSEFAFSMGPVLNPIAFILSTIRPDLVAKAISKAAFPLTSVYSTSFKCIRRSFLSLSNWVKFVLCYCFARLLISKVLRRSNLFAFEHEYIFASTAPTVPGLEFDNSAYVILQVFPW